MESFGLLAHKNWSGLQASLPRLHAPKACTLLDWVKPRKFGTCDRIRTYTGTSPTRSKRAPSYHCVHRHIKIYFIYIVKSCKLKYLVLEVRIELTNISLVFETSRFAVCVLEQLVDAPWIEHGHESFHLLVWSFTATKHYAQNFQHRKNDVNELFTRSTVWATLEHF